MHIADGVLTLEATLIVSIVSAGILYVGMKRLKEEHIAIAAVCSALFFVASFIHIPFGVTQIHLMLLGVIGLLVGLSGFVSIAIALILQALLMGYGGIASIGVNLFIMGVPIVLVHWLYKTALFQRLNDKVQFFLVGFIGTFFATLFLTVILYFSKAEYETAAMTILGVNSITMIIEGIVSMFLLLFIKKTYPKLLRRNLHA
ncbi:MAG: CbiM family transporter [Arcobacteraceae bacterium]